MVLRSLATRMPYWGFAGSCFFLAWMNGAFFTTALSGFRLQAGAASDIGLYWNLSLIGVFAGLVALTVCEGRFGQVALRPNVLVASTVFVCAGTLLMLVDPAVAPDAVVVLDYVGGFATGFFAAPFYIAWGQVYGLLDIDQAELVIPLAVALGQLLSLVFCGLEGWLAAACLVAAPVLTLACLLGSFARLGWGGEGMAKEDVGKGVRQPGTVSAGKAAERPEASKGVCPAMRADGFAKDASPVGASKERPALTGAPATRPTLTSTPTARPTLTGARFGLFVAVVWLVLSLMTTLTNSRVSNDFAHAYLVPFLVSFVVLLVLLLLYVGYTKRLSLLQTARIVVPVMVVSLLAVLVLPRDIVPDGYAARCAALGERFGLSPRETEIMGYLVRGRDLPFIRDALYISRNTINTHVRHIYGKMGIHSKQELIDLFEQPDPPRES